MIPLSEIPPHLRIGVVVHTDFLGITAVVFGCSGGPYTEDSIHIGWMEEGDQGYANSTTVDLESCTLDLTAWSSVVAAQQRIHHLMSVQDTELDRSDWDRGMGMPDDVNIAALLQVWHEVQASLHAEE